MWATNTTTALGSSEVAQTLLLRPQYSISLTKLLEASVTVFLTTLEDCVWLIPFVAKAPSTSIALVHGSLFIVTLVSISVATSALAFVISTLVNTDSQLILEATGATICWVLAGFFFCRSYLKKQRRRKEADSLRDQPSSINESTNSSTNGGYGAVSSTTTEAQKSDPHGHPVPEYEPLGTTSLMMGPNSQEIDDAEMGENARASPRSPSLVNAQPWVVISLTTLGSLDEVSYFPALIVGQVFTAAEVVAGTLIATLMILGLVDILSRQCSCCLHLLDQIPLYAVVSIFATILTINALLDLLE